MCPQEALPQAPCEALPQAWSCLVLSSLFDLERVITLKQLSTGPWVWRQRSVPYTGHWKYTAMCSLSSKLFLAFVESPLKHKCQVCAVTKGLVL